MPVIPKPEGFKVFGGRAMIIFGYPKRRSVVAEKGKAPGDLAAGDMDAPAEPPASSALPASTAAGRSRARSGDHVPYRIRDDVRGADGDGVNNSGG